VSFIGSYKDFPREKFSTFVLTNSVVAIGTASRDLYVSWGFITGGAAAALVTLRSTDNSGSWTFLVPANAVIPIGPFFSSAGLEATTAAPAGDVSLVLHYTQNP
jgi:hypothetical protein